MAAVIRVKRRRNEDPAEALILSQKKSRLDIEASNDVKLDSVLEFAGTLSSKNEPVSNHIKEAIRKKKLHRELHPHSAAESKPTSELVNRVRTQNTQISQNNRYQVICSKRALDIDSLDSSGNAPDESVENLPSITHCDSDTTQKECAEPRDSQRSKSNSSSSSAEQSKTTIVSNAQAEGVCSTEVTSTKGSNDSPPGSEVDTDSSKEPSTGISDKVFCLLDVEHKAQQEPQVTQASASGITVNNVPMASEKPVVPVEEESDDYVYDLYYAHTQLSERHLSDVLTVEAMCNELLYNDDPHSDEEDEATGLDEDSNDESNWRNDYPDEDPGFLENEGRDYDFENDMVERIFGDSDDEGDVLAYWMDTRCRIEVDCADIANDDDDGDKTDGSSADEYSETADN